MAAAKGELIVWTDDDVLVDPEWLGEYVGAARRWPEASFFAGTIEPLFEVEPPRWLVRHLEVLQACYAVNSHGLVVRPMASGEQAIGANMAVRANVLKHHSFDVRLGRVGPSQVRWEEVALIAELTARGHVGIWVGTARVKHYIPASRLTLDYVRSWYEGSGQSAARAEDFAQCQQLWGVPRYAWKRLVIASLKSFLSSPGKNVTWVNSFTESAYYRGLVKEFKRCHSSREVDRCLT